MKSKNELKIELRDWMTATSQIAAVKLKQMLPPDQKLDTYDLMSWWRLNYGIKMNEKWIKGH